MKLLSFARKHVRVLIALLNVALIFTGIQFANARAGKIGPRPQIMAVGDGTIAPATLPASPAAHSPSSQPTVSRETSHVAAPAWKHDPSASPIAGKGMWIWLFKHAEGGNPVRIVKYARALGLTHLYVRSSSTTSGLKFLSDIDRIVPVAHAAGIKVIAWDFPRLINPVADAGRMIRVIDHRTPGGDKVDGIAVDLETGGEGVSLTAARATRLASTLKRYRPNTFRVLVPPRPSAAMIRIYPYGIIPMFDAVAPMVYWHHRNAGVLVIDAIRYLKRFGRPIAPIGQAYDGSLDPGGKGGAPNGHTLFTFARMAIREGAVGVSFWSWQHANRDMFRGISRIDFPEARS